MLLLTCPHCGVTAEETEFAPGPLAAEFGLNRFREGRFIDESVAAGVAH